jgi:hypothetical protein
MLSGNGVSRRFVNSSPSIGTILNVGFSADSVPKSGASVKPPFNPPSGGVAPAVTWKLNVAVMLERAVKWRGSLLRARAMFTSSWRETVSSATVS